MCVLIDATIVSYMSYGTSWHVLVKTIGCKSSALWFYCTNRWAVLDIFLLKVVHSIVIGLTLKHALRYAICKFDASVKKTIQHISKDISILIDQDWLPWIVIPHIRSQSGKHWLGVMFDEGEWDFVKLPNAVELDSISTIMQRNNLEMGRTVIV